MPEDRKMEILHGVLDLMEEYKSLDIDVAFPEEGLKIHIQVEELGEVVIEK